MLKTVDSTTFDAAVLRAPQPVVVEFSAPWCGHCRRLEPTLESLAHRGQDIVQVNIDQSPELARRYGIAAIPALIRFRGGQPNRPLVGPDSAAVVELWLERS